REVQAATAIRNMDRRTHRYSTDRRAVEGAPVRSPTGGSERPVPPGPRAEALEAGLDLGQRAEPVSELGGHGRLFGQALLVENREPVLAQAGLRKLGEPARQRLRLGQALSGRNDAVGEPDGQRLVRVHRTAAEDEVERPAAA